MTIRRLSLSLPVLALLAAGAARAETSPAPQDPIDRAAFRIPIAPAYAPDKPILPAGVAQTSVDRSFREGVTGSFGFICGLQPPYAHDGVADVRGYDPDGKFIGAKLAFAFR